MPGRKHLVAAFVGALAVLLLGLAAVVPVKAQDSPTPERVESSAPSLERVIGAVTATNPAAKQIGLRLDAGGAVTVVLQDKTVYLRVPPGETDLKKAVTITPAEIGVGDRVYARGRVAGDQKSIAAMTVIVMTKADLTRTREQERAERQKRTVAGTISALDPKAQEITLSVRAREGTTTVVIQSSEKAVFRRYAADTVRLVQAKPSSFADLRVGDSLRVLGDRNSNGTRVTPEEIISGSFRNIAGIVVAIDVAAGEIRITDLQGTRPLTVRITPETVVRRIPPSEGCHGEAIARRTACRSTRPPTGRRPGRGADPNRGGCRWLGGFRADACGEVQ